MSSYERACPTCRGSTFATGKPCSFCRNTGRVAVHDCSPDDPGQCPSCRREQELHRIDDLIQEQDWREQAL